MQGFYDVDPGALEEFDWFPDSSELTEYLGLTDLRESAEKATQPEVESGLEDCAGSVLGDIGEDGLMWNYCENLTDAASGVFKAISEKLCGPGEPECSGLPAYFMERLSRRCEVVQTELPRGTEAGELPARIEACLLERGCAAAMVSDAQWRRLTGEPELPFVDSGVRTLQIIGAKENSIVVNDFAFAYGRSLEVSKGAFCSLYGILVEVYK